jgi:ThiF family
MRRGEFERAFNSRTLAYQPVFRPDDRPVIIHIGDDAHSAVGHALALALINQVARTHRHVVVIGANDRELLCQPVFGHNTIKEATLGLATAINPYITATAEPATPSLATIAIGQTGRPADLRVGCRGWQATFGPDARVPSDPTSLLGGMLAACISAAYAFHRLLGAVGAPAASYSLWDFGLPGGQPGPEFTGPLNIGRVLQVGAGGVGASLDFWLSLLGVTGEWTIVDGDTVDISNLNRQLAFLAAQAGFPDGPAQRKAPTAASLLGPAATAEEGWYGDNPMVTARAYDVVLALANERGVRNALQARQPPVLLHATTSANWEAQFHRHVAGHDDCINCRLQGAPPKLACARSEIETSCGPTDAALPFLSGSAGLLLLTGLIRLQVDALVTTPRNFFSLNVREPGPVVQAVRRDCRAGCFGWSSPDIRREIAGASRFARLDPATRREAIRP